MKPRKIVEISYPCGSILLARYVYTRGEYIGVRFPDETRRIDEVPAERCTIREVRG